MRTKRSSQARAHGVRHYLEHMKLEAAGRYREALVPANNAVELGKRVFGEQHETFAALLNNLAEFYRVMGAYAKVELLYKHALAIDDKLGKD